MVLRKIVTCALTLLGVCAVMLEPAMAQTPSPALLIAVQGKTPSEDVMLIVDPVARRVAGRVVVGGQPHSVAVSTDGKLAFTTNLTPGMQWLNYPGAPKRTGAPDPVPIDSISVIDLETQKLLRRTDVGPGAEPHGIAFAAGRVFFTVEGYKLVARYDPVTNRIDWMSGIGQGRVHELVVTRDGRRIFTANLGSDTVGAIAPFDPADDVQTFSGGKDTPPSTVSLIPVGNGPEGIAMAPDEKEVWVLNRGGGTLSIIDVATKKVTATIELGTKEPLRIRFTPDGKRALIADRSSGEMLIFDTATRKEIKRITGVGNLIHSIVVAPDGLFAYCAVQASADVVIIDLKTLEIAGRIPTGVGTKPFDGMDGMTWWQRK